MGIDRVSSGGAPRAAERPRSVQPRSTGASFRSHLGRRTPLSPRDAAAELAGAWQDVLGEPAPAGGVAVLWAQWALETGRGASMVGHNFGGLKGHAPDGGSTVQWTHEGHGVGRRRIRDRFRAYDSARAGARDYVRTLAQRYPDALAQARQGNAAGFVDALARRHYFTADPAVYRHAVQGLAHQYRTQGPDAAQPLTVDDPGPWASGVIEELQRATARHRG